MTRKQTLSIAASALLAGGIMTGCGGSSSGGSDYAVEAQASYVVFAPEGRLVLSSGDTECATKVDVNDSDRDGKLVFSAADLTCNSSEIAELGDDYNITVKSGATHVEELNATKDEEKELKYELKGKPNKKVNIFSTIAVNSGKSGDEIEDIDLNSDDTNATVKALGKIIGAKAEDLSADTVSKQLRDINFTELTKSDANTTKALKSVGDDNKTGLEDGNVTAIADAIDAGTYSDDNLSKAVPGYGDPKVAINSLSITGAKDWDGSAGGAVDVNDEDDNMTIQVGFDTFYFGENDKNVTAGAQLNEENSNITVEIRNEDSDKYVGFQFENAQLVTNSHNQEQIDIKLVEGKHVTLYTNAQEFYDETNLNDIYHEGSDDSYYISKEVDSNTTFENGVIELNALAGAFNLDENTIEKLDPAVVVNNALNEGEYEIEFYAKWEDNVSADDGDENPTLNTNSLHDEDSGYAGYESSFTVNY